MYNESLMVAEAASGMGYVIQFKIWGMGGRLGKPVWPEIRSLTLSLSDLYFYPTFPIHRETHTKLVACFHSSNFKRGGHRGTQHRLHFSGQVTELAVIGES
jgi:hypothetical protein